MSSYHIPVLYRHSIQALGLAPDSVCVDATFGGGGHSAGILEALGPQGRLLAFDQDPDAWANAIADPRFTLVKSNFRFVHNQCKALGYPQVDAILADLGVSSHQFDTAPRGFTFRFDAPLDMRMNPAASLDAATVLNTYTEEDLARVLRDYGELKTAASMAKALAAYRSRSTFQDNRQLEEALAGKLPHFERSKVLAQIYQALRIEVNHELRALEQFLEQALRLLRPGGRLVVISYHSLEDRIVKNFLRYGNVRGLEEKDLMGRRTQAFEPIFRKPLTPSQEEIAQNPRSRSAKLRGGIKCPADGRAQA